MSSEQSDRNSVPGVNVNGGKKRRQGNVVLPVGGAWAVRGNRRPARGAYRLQGVTEIPELPESTRGGSSKLRTELIDYECDRK